MPRVKENNRSRNLFRHARGSGYKWHCDPLGRSRYKAIVRTQDKPARRIGIVIATAARLDKQIAAQSDSSRLRRRLRSVQVPAQNKLWLLCQRCSTKQNAEERPTNPP